MITGSLSHFSWEIPERNDTGVPLNAVRFLWPFLGLYYVSLDKQYSQQLLLSIFVTVLLAAHFLYMTSYTLTHIACILLCVCVRVVPSRFNWMCDFSDCILVASIVKSVEWKPDWKTSAVPIWDVFARDASLWPPWLCVCPPLIEIIDEEAQSAHLRLFGGVIGFMFRLIKV